MPVNNINSSLHHSFVTGAVWPGRTKGGLVMVAQLQTDVSKYRLVSVRPNDCRSHIVAENGDRYTSIEAQHSIDTQGKIVGSLAMNSVAENKAAKGKNGHKNMTFNHFPRRIVHVVQFFTGKVDHHHIPGLIFQVHGYILVLQVPVQMITLMAGHETTRMLLHTLLPEQLASNTGLV